MPDPQQLIRLVRGGQSGQGGGGAGWEGVQVAVVALQWVWPSAPAAPGWAGGVTRPLASSAPTTRRGREGCSRLRARCSTANGSGRPHRRAREAMVRCTDNVPDEWYAGVVNLADETYSERSTVSRPTWLSTLFQSSLHSSSVPLFNPSSSSVDRHASRPPVDSSGSSKSCMPVR